MIYTDLHECDTDRCRTIERDVGLAAAHHGEAGVGVSLLSSLYKNRDKELSTAFQFADHVGVGYTTAKWDFGLKLQHYSNASIKRPNGGANWVIAKAAYRF